MTASVSTTSSSSTICTIDPTLYPYEASVATTLSATFSYVTRSAVSIIQQPYCFNCQVYNYDVSFGGSTCSAGCAYTSLTSDITQHSILSSSVGCLDCTNSAFGLEQVSYRSELDLYVRNCLASSTTSSPTCTFSQYLDPTSKSCIDCASAFPNCASCNSTQCNICLQYFYWHPNGFNPSTNSRQGMCLFDVCPQGYCKDTIRQVCVASTLSNCFECSQNSSVSPVIQQCTLCQKGYLPNYSSSSSQSTCKALTGTATWNYFVKAGAPILLSQYTYDPTINDGQSPATSFIQIQEAINAIHKRQQVNYIANVTANVYLGQGEHYFMQCDGDETASTFSSSSISSLFVNYCQKLKIYKETALSDNIIINIAPLQCKQSTALGLSSVESKFKAMCIDLLIDSGPTVYVNSATTYFNISGTMTFDSIIFNGINAFARPTTSTFDLSVFPTLLCDNINDIQYGDNLLSFQKMSTYDYVTNNIKYSCKDAWYAGSKIPKTYTSGTRCALNNNQLYYPKQQSSLSCGLTPNNDDFFYIRSGGNTYSKRQQTLFNLYAFPEYLTTFSLPPQLKITNCEFRYFMGNYTSLINVENDNLRRVSKTAPISLYGSIYQLNRYFYTYSGAARGARILISNSQFSESRFCLGMIVHRKQLYMPYITSFLNYTQVHLDVSTLDDSGSYIYIQDSSFINMNYLTNISALAIYQGQTPVVILNGSYALENITYQAKIHKGIILNLEDFNGYIEIAGSTFQKNMHFIPEILIYPYSTSSTDTIDHFEDQFYTQEYKLSICVQATLSDSYMFQDGVNLNDDFEEYYMKFERLGLIYIGRSKKPVIIRQNFFQENIGTFGSAISISSPNWQQLDSTNIGPYIIISDNTFDKNFAYLSGGAIYIHNTFLADNVNEICGGGIALLNNKFTNNTGMKIHNGGAVAGSCYQIDESDYEDFDYTSSFWLNDPNSNLKIKIKSQLASDVSFSILATQFMITNSNFTENYSGQKGTAVYLRQINRMYIKNSTFLRNGPVYSILDISISPYSTYFTLKNYSVIFRDPVTGCKNEFNYIDKCANPSNMIDWPQTRGAVYVEHCNQQICMSTSNIQQLTIDGCVFASNLAGPFLDPSMDYDLAQSLYISNGFNNTITNTVFRDHWNYQQLNVTNTSTRLQAYFPNIYFKYSQAAVIRFMINPLYLQGSYIFDYQNIMRNVSFLRNKHMQILGQDFLKQFYGSLISFETGYMLGQPYAPQLELNQCTFRENQFIGNETSLIFMFKGILRVFNSFAYGNGYLSKTTTNNSYKFHVVNRQGGAIYVRSQDFRTTYKVLNENIQFQFGVLQGAISGEPHDPNYVNFIIANSTFMNNNALDGQSIFFDSPATVTIINCTFIDNLWPANMTAYMESQFVPQTMKLNEFVQYKFLYQVVDLQPANSGAVYIEQNFNDQPVLFLDQTFIDINSPYLGYCSVIDSSFYNLSSAYGVAVTGGKQVFMRVLNSNFNIRAIIQNNTSQGYGVLYAMDSWSFLMSNLFVYQNYAVQSGSGFGSTGSNVSVDNCTFIENVAGDKATLYLYEDNNFTCSSCNITNNTAADSSAVFSLNDVYGYLLFVNSYFSNNTALSNTASFILTNVTFIDSTFIDNVAQQINHGITLLSSNVIVSNMTVNYTMPSFIQNLSENVDSGFFNLNYQSSLVIANQSTFENCRGALASVIYATGFSSITLQDNITIKNCASFSGSTLYLSLTNLAEVHDTIFENNTQSDIVVQSVNLNISNTFFSGGAQNSIMATLSNVTIRETTFADSLNYNIQGKAIYCSCYNMFIEKCLFKNLTAVEGGALYLTSSDHTSNFTIYNNTFYNNSAMQGGAINVLDAGHLNISMNDFLYNTAFLFDPESSMSSKLVQKGSGGAINLDCFNENIGLSNNCDLFIGQNNTFQDNTATDDGGAIVWYSNRYFDDGSNIFQNNSAPYANDVGNYASEIIFQYVSNGDYLNPIQNLTTLFNATNLRQLLQTYTEEELRIIRVPLSQRDRQGRRLNSQNFTLNGVVSGTPIQFVGYVVDMDGNLYKSDSSSVATLKSLTKGVIIQNFEVNANEGVYNFSKFTINLVPGSQAQMTFQITGFQTYQNDISFIQNFPLLIIQSRQCAQGEQYTTDNRCLQCKAGTYLYSAPTTVTACQACQDSSICYGLSSVAPQPGYWRSSNTSSNFIQCPNTAACLGGDQNNPLGVCATGYTGAVCGNCIVGYKKNLNFRCSKCPNQAANSIEFIGFLIIICIISVILVRSNIMSVHKERPVYSVYMKMMTNHFQILSAILAIDYNWPTLLQNLQDDQLELSSFTDEIFSFDCFLQSNGFVDESDRIYMQKLIFYAMLPLILTAVSVVVWYVIGFFQQSYRFADRLIGTVVVLLFLIHTSIAKILFSAFNCLEIDGVSRLKDNMEMVCYKDKHLLYVLAIVIPALIIWIFGIPFAALVLMLRNRTQIQHMHKFHEQSRYDQKMIRSIKIRIGFLLSGYEQSKFFWEILIIYRKILIVMVIVILNNASVEAQVLVVMLILVLSTLMTIHYNPYYTEILNRMELYSLITACVTMYGGMFYVTGKHYTYMDPPSLGWIFLILILIPNLLFLAYWSYHMRVEILKLLYQNYPRVFSVITCNYYKDEDFERMYMSEITQIDAVGVRADQYKEGEIISPTKERDGLENGVDDFSNVIMKRFQEEEPSADKTENKGELNDSNITESDQQKYQDKVEKLENKLKGSGGRLGSSEIEDDTGESNDKSVSSKDVRLQFPAHMMRRIVQPEEVDKIKSDSNQQQRAKSPQKQTNQRGQQNKKYNKITDSSPMTSKRQDENYNTLATSRIDGAGGALSSRKIFPQQLVNQLTNRKGKTNSDALFGDPQRSRGQQSNYKSHIQKREYNPDIDSIYEHDDHTVRTLNNYTDRATDRQLIDQNIALQKSQRSRSKGRIEDNDDYNHQKRRESMFSSSFMIEEDSRKQKYQEEVIRDFENKLRKIQHLKNLSNQNEFDMNLKSMRVTDQEDYENESSSGVESKNNLIKIQKKKQQAEQQNRSEYIGSKKIKKRFVEEEESEDFEKLKDLVGMGPKQEQLPIRKEKKKKNKDLSAERRQGFEMTLMAKSVTAQKEIQIQARQKSAKRSDEKKRSRYIDKDI